MFSGKLFTIIGAVLAVAVNGSPVDANGPPTKVADNKPQDVCRLHGPLDVDDGEIQSLTALSTQQAMGNVTFCADSGSGGACKQVPVHTDICNNVPTGFDKNISAFHPGQGINCTLFEYVNSLAATERPII